MMFCMRGLATLRCAAIPGDSDKALYGVFRSQLPLFEYFDVTACEKPTTATMDADTTKASFSMSAFATLCDCLEAIFVNFRLFAVVVRMA